MRDNSLSFCNTLTSLSLPYLSLQQGIKCSAEAVWFMRVLSTDFITSLRKRGEAKKWLLMINTTSFSRHQWGVYHLIASSFPPVSQRSSCYIGQNSLQPQISWYFGENHKLNNLSSLNTHLVYSKREFIQTWSSNISSAASMFDHFTVQIRRTEISRLPPPHQRHTAAFTGTRCKHSEKTNLQARMHIYWSDLLGKQKKTK